MATRQSLIQLVRYGALGVLTNTAGYVLYLGITYLGLGAKVAMTILYCVGVCISFIGNRNLVFSSHGRMLGAGMRYLVVYAVGYAVNYLILTAFVDRLGYPHAYVQAASIVIVALFLFAAFKLFVFPHTDTMNGNVG
ncbi:GtrA family protein [Rhizobium hidalgonense]|uniref:GtrA family protein n=1 Tax=Rhizobium hidalgonense TaxID=1538159 RepID=A0AAJ2H1R2_9HYPH|nr:GtrA family protein [Rhizobium hidalgonense]MDR9777567.1 GtrA family protein [Rhizobium hidalgonense]MDR9823908.1 GtrA family protein [Rhizobium hidalgonense]